MDTLINLIYRLLRHPFSSHEWGWGQNYHGDIINHLDGARSRWDCKKCGASELRYELGAKP